jgi:hypothetical protein
MGFALAAATATALAQSEATLMQGSASVSASESVELYPGGSEQWDNDSHRHYESVAGVRSLSTSVPGGTHADFASGYSGSGVTASALVSALPTLRNGSTNADVSFSMSFDLPQAARYRLSMEVLGDFTLPAFGQSATFSFELRGPQGALLARDLSWNNADEDFLARIDALFAAGTYVLSGSGHAYGDSSFMPTGAEASMRFDLMPTPVPEPASWTLLAAGIAGIAWSRRRLMRASGAASNPASRHRGSPCGALALPQAQRAARACGARATGDRHEHADQTRAR